jgi:hypothetical protein
LIQVIWDLDLSVFKAKISTSATGRVEDKFWITDNTQGLPMSAREREIRRTISAIIGPGAECTVIPVEKELSNSRSAMLLMNEGQVIGSACGLRRQCKDSASHSNLRFLTNKYNTNTFINSTSGNLQYCYTSSSSVGGSRGSSYYGGSQHGGSVHLIGAGDIACIDENNNKEAVAKVAKEEEEDSIHHHHHHSTEQHTSSAGPSPRSSDEASFDKHEDHFFHDLSDNLFNSNTVYIPNCSYNTAYTSAGAKLIAGTAAAADYADAVEISVENDTSAAFTLVTLRCNDRKGLLYDIMRAFKDMDVRIGFGRLKSVGQDDNTDNNGDGGDINSRKVEADLFVQDAQSGKILEETMLEILVGRVRVAIRRPYQLVISINKKQERKGKSIGTEIAANAATAPLIENNIAIKANNKSTDLLEVTVITELDAGGRGRPRVTYDVTKGLDQAQFGVVSAEIYVNEMEHDRRDTYCHGVEVHQFLVESLHDFETTAGEDIKQEHVKCIDSLNNKKDEEDARMMMNKKIASLQSAIKGQLTGTDCRAYAASVPDNNNNNNSIGNYSNNKVVKRGGCSTTQGGNKERVAGEEDDGLLQIMSSQWRGLI